MSVENDFIAFAVGTGANVISQATYAALTSITQNGFQAGIATSAQLNKVWRQSSIMSAVMAQFIVAQTGQPAIDDGTTATLVANFITAVAVSARQNPVLTDTGTANTYAVANLSAFTAYPSVSGLVIDVSIANANTGASTLNVDGLGAKPIYGLALQPLQGGELIVKGIASLLYIVASTVNSGNGAWVVMECAGGAQQVAPATQSQHAVQLQQAQAMRGQYSGFYGFNANSTLTAAQAQGGIVQWYGATGTLTLPSGASVGGNNTTTTFFNHGSGVLTVAISGSGDFINTGSGNVSSVTLQSGDDLEICWRGGNEIDAVSGSALRQFNPLVVGTATSATQAAQKQQLGNMQGVITVSANTALTAIQAGSYVQISSGSGLTVTLPPAAAGAAFPIYNNTNATHTLKGNGSQVINNGSGNSNTYTILPWAAIWVTSDGASFSIISGAGDVLLTTNGWERKPSGLIECWAQGTTNSSGTVTITLPITFPNSQLIGMVCGQNGTAVAACVTLQSLSTSQIIVNAVNGSASPINGLQVNIRALGK